jgi:hypothetical protein
MKAGENFPNGESHHGTTVWWDVCIAKKHVRLTKRYLNRLRKEQQGFNVLIPEFAKLLAPLSDRRLAAPYRQFVVDVEHAFVFYCYK